MFNKVNRTNSGFKIITGAVKFFEKELPNKEDLELPDKEE